MSNQIQLAYALVENPKWSTPQSGRFHLALTKPLLSKVTNCGSPLLTNFSSRAVSEESHALWAKERINGSLKRTCLWVPHSLWSRPAFCKHAPVYLWGRQSPSVFPLLHWGQIWVKIFPNKSGIEMILPDFSLQAAAPATCEKWEEFFKKSETKWLQMTNNKYSLINTKQQELC